MRVARKFTFALVAGILVVLTMSAVVRVKREQALFTHYIARDTQALGRALGHAVERTWQTRGQEEALELIAYASKQETHLRIRWVWLGAAIGDAHSPVAPSSSLDPLARGEPVVLPLGKDQGSIYAYVPVRVPEGRLGAIEIADPLVDEQAYLERSIVEASVTAFLLVILCAMLAWFLGLAFIGRPMGRLVEHAQAIGRGELGRKLSLSTHDEIGELASEMDAMSEELRKGRDQLREETRSRIAAIEQLRHADRLATVGTLASGIAHELGTPINVIEGHAQLIRENDAAGNGAKETAAIIIRQCKRMAQIIRQLLDFARQGGPRDGSSDVHEVIGETLKMVEPLMRKHDVEATVEAADTSLRVNVNFHQLQQVIANIVLNALHAMPKGGRLDVRTNRARAKPAAGGSHETDFVMLSIQDSGIGMDRETTERIFEPFFTTKDVGEGTGLGLSVAYGIIEHHGGWIEVQSSPQRGSTFTIYLPPESA